MKKRGGGGRLLLTRNPTRIPVLRSIATKDLSSPDHGSRARSISSFNSLVCISGGLLQDAIGPHYRLKYR